ncbi:glycerophosphodiester phosphodiesterase family protein [Mongoliitalea lutea]|uniref:Glycerophosphoryl diester phosphodiesterase n=1 Tax=Mongoliitalea lutea TaxID=849756 RepID=A0A8J3CYM2_9BACT|nr:glycerophosphodiester phosphodiesterase family protein [Mongoliitalea lutea]GHB35879.1 glycerophosphoryl diester phosphodiesterase [Mongoliitalea lutea]
MKINFFGLLVFLSYLACSSPQTNTDNAIADHLQHSIVVTSTAEARDFYTWSPDRIPMVSAHRGGPYPGFPENSLEAFENTLKHTPSIIEFDVALTKDSVLVLMHDNTLDRTTTGKGRVVDHTYEEIQEFFLVDKEGTITTFKVPTLEEVLAWGKGRTLFTVDIKREVPFEMIIDAIKKQEAEAYAAVITYSLEAAKKIHRLHPDLMLSVSIRNEEELTRFQSSGIPVDRWIAFTGTSERAPEFNKQLHELGVFTILGTLGNLDRSAIARGDQLYAGFVQNGADILATDRPIEAAKAIESLIPKGSSKGKYFGQ